MYRCCRGQEAGPGWGQVLVDEKLAAPRASLSPLSPLVQISNYLSCSSLSLSWENCSAEATWLISGRPPETRLEPSGQNWGYQRLGVGISLAETRQPWAPGWYSFSLLGFGLGALAFQLCALR